MFHKQSEHTWGRGALSSALRPPLHHPLVSLWGGRCGCGRLPLLSRRSNPCLPFAFNPGL